MKKEIFVSTDTVGFCAAFPIPPVIPRYVADPLAEDAEPGNQFDRKETVQQIDLLNSYWKQRCPDEWEEFRRSIN